jgi:nitrogen fixation protein FixH
MRKDRGLRWPVAITLVLGTVVAANIWVAMKAGSDPSFAIEPDYYKKAIAWDSAMSQARTNAALGWRVAPSLAAFSADSGAALRVVVTDADGRPVRDARVTVEAMFNARASVVFTAQLLPDGHDAYVTQLPVDRAGVWEMRLDMTKDGARFMTVARLDAVRGSNP